MFEIPENTGNKEKKVELEKIAESLENKMKEGILMEELGEVGKSMFLTLHVKKSRNKYNSLRLDYLFKTNEDYWGFEIPSSIIYPGESVQQASKDITSHHDLGYFLYKIRRENKNRIICKSFLNKKKEKYYVYYLRQLRNTPIEN